MASPEIPTLRDLPAKPKRIILHWTGGAHKASALERQHYHYLIEGDGTVVAGAPVAWNMRTVGPDRPYAAHTRGMNSYSVGVAFCGMHGATSDTDGPYPLSLAQVEAGCAFVGKLCRVWGFPVTPSTVFTHPEAQRLHGVTQAGKWDLDRLPFRPGATPQENADWLRGLIRTHAEAA